MACPLQARACAPVRSARPRLLGPPCVQVTVQTKQHKSYHMGRTLLERPVISIYALRSANQDGALTDWQLPESLLAGAGIAK